MHLQNKLDEQQPGEDFNDDDSFDAESITTMATRKEEIESLHQNTIKRIESDRKARMEVSLLELKDLKASHSVMVEKQRKVMLRNR
jgi:hypothetical protein